MAAHHIILRYERSVRARRDQRFRRALAHAGQRTDRRQDIAVLINREIRRARFVNVDRAHVYPAQVHFNQHFKDRLFIRLGGGQFILIQRLNFLDRSAQRFHILRAHIGSIEAFHVAVQIAAVIRGGIKDLEIRDAQRHCDVCYGVRAREHVFDLLAAVDVPRRRVHRRDGGFHLRLQALALSHVFHGFERDFVFNAEGDQRVHNIIARADAFLQRNARLYQIRRVAQPYVRAVGKAGYANQFLH